MIRGLARALLTLALTASLAATLWSAAQIARDPLLRPMVERTSDEIVAATDRLVALHATPERLTLLIEARLVEEPRNWIALTALDDLARERGLDLPPVLRDRYQAAHDADTGVLARAGDCAACAWDPATCSPSNVLVCQAPVALTPVGDLAGIARAGVAYATGDAVDGIDLGLSVVGLGATALVLASGGSSATVKAGASLLRTARRMDLASPRLMAMAGDAVRHGIDWAALPGVRSTGDLARAVRPAAFAPLAATVTDLDRLRRAVGTTGALHLLPLVDGADDARRLARAAEALGPRVVARAEVLGKARLFRATQRIGNVAWAAISGLVGLMMSLAMLVGGWLQALVLRALQRAAA
ncbi:MAG: hypothetical protein ACT4OK_18235 [Gemmobacter sp.]